MLRGPTEAAITMADTTPLALVSLLDDTLSMTVVPINATSEDVSRATVFWLRNGIALDLESVASRTKLFYTACSLATRVLSSLGNRFNYPDAVSAQTVNQIIADLSNRYTCKIELYPELSNTDSGDCIETCSDVSLRNGWDEEGGYPITMGYPDTYKRKVDLLKFFAIVGNNAQEIVIPEEYVYCEIKVVSVPTILTYADGVITPKVGAGVFFLFLYFSLISPFSFLLV